MVTKEEVLELVGSTASANAIKSKLLPALQKYFYEEDISTESDLLEEVSPENTIVWTFGLLRRIRHRGTSELDVDQLNLFIKYFENLDSKQVRTIPKQFKECYTMILRQFNSADSYAVAKAHMLVKAAERLDHGMTDPQLTTVHADAVEMCWYSSCSLIVQPLLRRDYYKIDRNYESARSEILRFFYFAALLLLKEEDYTRAHDYLTIVTTATVSFPLKKDAHYKCQLAALLVNGQVKETQFRPTDQAQAEPQHKEAHFYSMFANNLMRDRPNDELLASVPAHLKENGDYELMQLCVERKRELTLVKQRDAFASLRMKDLPASIARNNEEEAEKFVTHLLMRGKVDGYLTHTSADTILELPPTKSQPAEHVAHLEELLEQVAEISHRLDLTGRQMITKPSFSRGMKAIARGTKEKQRGGGTFHESMEGGMGIKRSLHGGRGQRRRVYEARDDSTHTGDSSDEDMISS